MKSRPLATAFVLFIFSGCSSGLGFNAPAPVALGAGITSLAKTEHQGDVVTRAFKSGQYVSLAWDPDDKLLVGVNYKGGLGKDVYVVLGRNDGFRFPEETNAVAYDAETRAFYSTVGHAIYRSSKGSAPAVVTQSLKAAGALASDGKGNIYAVDGSRIVLARNGSVTQVSRPGTVDTAIYGINRASIAVDTKDYGIYVSDPKGSVGRILPTGGLTTVARGFGEIGGIVYDASHDRLIVSGAKKNQLLAVTSTGATTVVAGYGPAAYADGNGWRAFLNEPGVLTYAGSSGKVYFSEANRVLSYAVTGPPAPKAAQPTKAFHVAIHVPYATMGNPVLYGNAVWFTLEDNLDELTPDGKLTVVKMPKGVDPIGPMTFDAHGNLWMIYYGPFSTQSSGIAERQPDGTVTPYVINSSSLGSVTTPTIGADGNPWFVASGSSAPAIGTIDNGKLILYPVSWEPDSVAAGTDGTIWYGTAYAGIGRLTTSGSELSPIYTGTDVGPMVAGPSNVDVWFTNEGGGLYRITANGHVQTIHIGATFYGLTVAPDDQAWLAVGNGIVEVKPSGKALGYYLPGSGPDGADGVAASNDAIWITTSAQHVFLMKPQQYLKLGLPYNTAIGN